MHILLNNDEVAKIISEYFKVDLVDVEVDDENNFSLEVKNVMIVNKEVGE